MATVAKNTEGTYSSEDIHKATTKAIERMEKKVDMIRLKDLASAKRIFKGALNHRKRGNVRQSKEDFWQARGLANEAFSPLDPMDKIVCSDVQICSARGYMNDSEFLVEVQNVFTALLDDKDVRKELLADRSSYWVAASIQRNRHLKNKFHRLLISTLAQLPVGSSRILPWEDLSEEWKSILTVPLGSGKSNGSVLITQKLEEQFLLAKKESTLKGHANSVLCVAVLPNGDVVSGSWDRTLKIWSRSTLGDGNDGGNGGEQWTCTHTLEGHTNWVRCVAVLSNGDVVSGSDDNTLKIWVPRYTS